jgi:hypothetical protein
VTYAKEKEFRQAATRSVLQHWAGNEAAETDGRGPRTLSSEYLSENY